MYTMSKLKVGIAGYGIVGRRRHLYINEHPYLEVTAVCEQNFASDYSGLPGIRCFNNYHDLLKENLDILFVCLTNNVAAEVTIAGLEKGLHVFCEKPPGMNVEEKRDMCRFILKVNDELGTTIVLIEHDMGVVMDISDRVVVLDYGKIIGDDVPDNVRSNKKVIDAYLGVAHD